MAAPSNDAWCTIRAASEAPRIPSRLTPPVRGGTPGVSTLSPGRPASIGDVYLYEEAIAKLDAPTVDQALEILRDTFRVFQTVNEGLSPANVAPFGAWYACLVNARDAALDKHSVVVTRLSRGLRSGAIKRTDKITPELWAATKDAASLTWRTYVLLPEATTWTEDVFWKHLVNAGRSVETIAKQAAGIPGWIAKAPEVAKGIGAVVVGVVVVGVGLWAASRYAPSRA